MNIERLKVLYDKSPRSIEDFICSEPEKAKDPRERKIKPEQMNGLSYGRTSHLRAKSQIGEHLMGTATFYFLY